MSNNAPDYQDNLVFPPKEELSMPLCDIVELKEKIEHMNKAYNSLVDVHSKTVGKLAVASLALKLLADKHSVAAVALEKMERMQ